MTALACPGVEIRGERWAIGQIPAAYRLAYELWIDPDHPYNIADFRVVLLTLRLWGVDLPLDADWATIAETFERVTGLFYVYTLNAVWDGIVAPGFRPPPPGATLPIPADWYYDAEV